jgi:hypothetical protein
VHQTGSRSGFRVSCTNKKSVVGRAGEPIMLIVCTVFVEDLDIREVLSIEKFDPIRNKYKMKKTEKLMAK